ncbi:MAG: sugar phosphate isomerase/epimerase family protein [Pirellulaceae bacterium]
MKLKLACADFTFPLLPHEKVLDLIALLQFDGVDIGLFEGRSHLHPSKVFQNARQGGEVIRQQTADRGLEVADVFLQTAPDFHRFAVNHPEPERRRKARDWFRRTLEYATGAKCPHVTALPGVTFEEIPEVDSFGRCCDELAWRVEQANTAGITFAVEAHIGSIVPTPAEAQRLVQSVPGLTLTLDYTHFAYLGLPDSEVEPLLTHASHFHARGARKDRLQASLSDNVIDYKRILHVMDSTGYRGYLGIEYVWIDWEHCNEVDNLSETILFRDYFRSQLEEDVP